MKHFIRVLLFILAYGVAFYGLSYLSFDVKGILQGKEDLWDSRLYQLGFYIHVLLGPLALLSGPWQFLPGFRAKQPDIHRKIGYVYVLSITLSGLAGLLIAPFAETGEVASTGFALLAILWLYTTYEAVKAIRNHQLIEHQRWMYRSYALTLAAVTLRIWLPLSMILGISFTVAYPVIAWLCWVPNLLIALWITRKKAIIA